MSVNFIGAVGGLLPKTTSKNKSPDALQAYYNGYIKLSSRRLIGLSFLRLKQSKYLFC